MLSTCTYNVCKFVCDLNKLVLSCVILFCTSVLQNKIRPFFKNMFTFYCSLAKEK